MSLQTSWFTATAGQQVFVLPQALSIVGVYLNGLLEPPDTYSLAPDQITLTVTFGPGAGEQVAVVFQPFVPPAPPPPFPPMPALSSFKPTGPAGLINVSEVVVDPDLAQPFIVLRSTGEWVNGTWVSQTRELQQIGVISVASPSEIGMVAEGDVITSARVFHTDQPIFKTREKEKGSSDILVWRNRKYRVLHDSDYQDYGYWRAVGSRMSGA